MQRMIQQIKFCVIEDDNKAATKIVPKVVGAELPKSPKKKKAVRPKVDRYNMKRHIDERPDSRDTKEFLNNMIELAKIETQKEIEAIRQEVRQIVLCL